MRSLFSLLALALLLPLQSRAQARIVLDEIDMGLMASYHMLVTDRVNLVLGEEYEIGAYMQDENSGALIAVTSSYVRNGAFQSNFNLPQYNFQVGKFTTAKVKMGKLWELNSFDVLLTGGFGWFHGADYSEKTGMYGLLFLDPEDQVSTFTVPFSLDFQWYGWDGSINSLGMKYELNGWGNYLGLGFTYLL